MEWFYEWECAIGILKADHYEEWCRAQKGEHTPITPAPEMCPLNASPDTSVPWHVGAMMQDQCQAC